MLGLYFSGRKYLTVGKHRPLDYGANRKLLAPSLVQNEINTDWNALLRHGPSGADGDLNLNTPRPRISNAVINSDVK